MKTWNIENISDLFLAKSQLMVKSREYEKAAYYLLLAITEIGDLSKLELYFANITRELKKTEFQFLLREIDEELHWLISDVLDTDVQIMRLRQFYEHLPQTAVFKSNQTSIEKSYSSELYIGILEKALINIYYKNLITAYYNKNWQEVIRLGGEMKILGYNENVNPINEKVFEAKNILGLNKLSITVNGETDDIEWKNEEIVYPIPKSGKLTVKFGDKLLLDAIIGKRQISQINIDQHSGFQHHHDKKLIIPDDKFDIEIIPGMEYKLVIKPKEGLDEKE